MRKVALIAALLLCIAGSARAGITPRAFNAGDSSNAATESLSTNLPAGVADGDTVLVAIACQSILTITPPANWTSRVGPTTWNTTYNFEVFSHRCASGDCASAPAFSMPAPGAICSYVDAAYIGVASTGDGVNTVNAQANAASTTITFPTITPTQPGDEVVMLGGATGTGATFSAFSIGFGEVTRNTNAPCAVIGDHGLGASGVATGSVTATISASRANVGALVSLIPASIPVIVNNGYASGNSDNTTVATIDMSLPATVANNDMIIAMLNRQSTAVVTPPANYTQIIQQPNTTPSASTAVFWHRWATGDPTSGLTFSWTGNTKASWITAAYSNVRTDAAPPDASGGQANTASTTDTAPSIAPASSPDMLIGLWGIFANAVLCSAPSLGNIQLRGSNATGVTGYCLSDTSLTASGATGTQTLTWGSSASNQGVHVALEPPTPTPTPTFTPTQTATPTATATPNPETEQVGPMIKQRAHWWYLHLR